MILKLFDCLVFLRPTLESCIPPSLFPPPLPLFLVSAGAAQRAPSASTCQKKREGRGKNIGARKCWPPVRGGGWVQQLGPGNAGHFTGRWAGRAFGPGGRWPLCVGGIGNEQGNECDFVGRAAGRTFGMGNARARGGGGGGQKRGGRERRGLMREYEQSLLREIGAAPFFLALGAPVNSICRGGPCCDPKTF